METDRSRGLLDKLQATQEQNEILYTMIERTKKMIQRARLERSRIERSLLLEKLHFFAKNPVRDDMDETTPPQSPSEPRPAAQKTEDERTGGNKLPNAYTVFCDEERDNVVKALEESGLPIQSGQVQSTLSDRWKAPSKDQKKPFSERDNVVKALEESGLPIKSDQVQSTLSDRWKALPKDQKKPYCERARELKKRAESEDTVEESMREAKEVKKQVKEEGQEDHETEDTRGETEEPPTEPPSELASEPMPNHQIWSWLHSLSGSSGSLRHTPQHPAESSQSQEVCVF